jgi:mannose-6-phosphate isomerase-like protein (cupin superfamily)
MNNDEFSPNENYEKFDFPNVPTSGNKLVIRGAAGEIFDFKQTGETSGDTLLFAKLTVPPDVGPPPHIHHWIDEWFYAPEGGFMIFVGEKSYPDVEKIPGVNAPKDTVHLISMRPKELFYVPRSYIHGFVNISNISKEIYLVWTPDIKTASMLPYFKKTGTIVNGSEDPGKPDTLSKIRMVSLGPEHGTNQSSDFWQYVDKVTENGPFPDKTIDNHKQKLLNLIDDLKLN